MSDGGKGSKPRPFSVDQDQYSKNWDLIFGKRNEKAAEQTREVDQSSESGGLDVPGLQKDSIR